MTSQSDRKGKIHVFDRFIKLFVANRVTSQSDRKVISPQILGEKVKVANRVTSQSDRKIKSLRVTGTIEPMSPTG